MGRQAARRRRKFAFLRKNFLSVAGIVLILTVIAALLFALLPLLNPYRSLLKDAGVDAEECHYKKGVLSLTLQGDSLGILSCRTALNALRAENPPDTVAWTLVKDGETILTGTVDHVASKKTTESPRVETLSEEMTLLKLTYELAQNGISAQGECSPTVGLSGKTVTLTVPTNLESLTKISTCVPAVLEAVNREGGGIVRCDVLFAEDNGIFAAASYDLVYGDTLYSSAFYQN